MAPMPAFGEMAPMFPGVMPGMMPPPAGMPGMAPPMAQTGGSEVFNQNGSFMNYMPPLPSQGTMLPNLFSMGKTDMSTTQGTSENLEMTQLKQKVQLL